MGWFCGRGSGVSGMCLDYIVCWYILFEVMAMQIQKTVPALQMP